LDHCQHGGDLGAAKIDLRPESFALTKPLGPGSLKDHQKETELFEHGPRVIKNPNHGNSQLALSASRAAIVGCFV
jgi:hypothetical protein